MPEVIDDLVVIGLAAPQHLADGRTTVCIGGWSPSRGFIRIYPAKPEMDLHRWDIIEVERKLQDTREESWKIVGSNQDWDNLHEKIEKVGDVKDPYQRRELVINNVSPCVSTLNEKHQSLGFIHPSKYEPYCGENPQYGQPFQLPLFTTHAKQWAMVKRDYKLEPRLKYTCSECETKQGFHDQVVLEWGWYEWMRKNPDNMEQVFKNALMYSEKHEIYLLVGNQENQRTSYMVINVIPVQKNPEPPKPVQRSLF